VLLGVFGAAFMLGNLPWSYAGYTALSLLVILPREAFLTPMSSDARLTLVVFPLFILIARAGRRPWVDRLVTVSFPVFLTFFLIFFVRYGFVG
jgi:hypothetical protein